MKLCEKCIRFTLSAANFTPKVLECRLVNMQFIIVLYLQYVCVNLQCICKGKRA